MKSSAWTATGAAGDYVSRHGHFGETADSRTMQIPVFPENLPLKI
jgi:hypothetical protein